MNAGVRGVADVGRGGLRVIAGVGRIACFWLIARLGLIACFWLIACLGSISCLVEQLVLGLGVAEAMDTAQRGMGLSWVRAAELIARSAAWAAERGAAIACGVGTDQLADGQRYPVTEIVKAYEQQLSVVQSAGAEVILMASRALAASARGPRDYLEVYGALLKQADRPVILIQKITPAAAQVIRA